MNSFVSLLVLTLSHVELSFAANLPCYYPDGSIPTDYIWEPCTGSKYSSCCVPSEGDICQADGLCYFPDEGMVYRGTCTDQTWKDPACNVDKCVSGFETTWQWVGECDSSGSTSTVCGSISDGAHATPTCAVNAVLNSAFVTTTSTTSAHIYSPPPSIDTARFSVETDRFTTTITANQQSTTLTSTYESTKTNALNRVSGGSTTATATATATSTGTAAPTDGGNTPNKKKTVTLSIGVFVGIGIGILLAILVALAILFYIRQKKKQGFKKSEATKLDDAPPPNGPVGADQVYPYEAPVNEVTSLSRHTYASLKIDTYEMDDRAAMSREKKSHDVVEMHAEHGGLRSPAPAYHEAVMPVELDGTSASRW